MKISICIPQYNRIELLVKSLKIIEKQTYPDIEIVVSDDCSTDDTMAQIENLKRDYKYPIVLEKFEKNMGYDRNYRRCIELGTGDYCFVIGNDDTLMTEDAIEHLVDFLKANDSPDLGFCNYAEERTGQSITRRALSTRVIGSGIDVAIKNYGGFSFVGGLIYKKTSFDKYNTSKHDGSIYSQMYLSLLMMASGCRVFSIEKPLVLKDIRFHDGSDRWSYYIDGIPKTWKDYRKMDGGLPSVVNVLISATEDAIGKPSSSIAFRILSRMYAITYPHWVVAYNKYGGYAPAIGLIHGMIPWKISSWNKINFLQKGLLSMIFFITSLVALIFPVKLFDIMTPWLYKMVKKNG
jgi:glycosyltransferase involved in cell wall biosynthesis